MFTEFVFFDVSCMFYNDFDCCCLIFFRDSISVPEKRQLGMLIESLTVQQEQKKNNKREAKPKGTNSTNAATPRKSE